MKEQADPICQPVVVVTGGTRGIGRAIVDQFVEAGARVIATGTSEEQVRQLNERQSDELQFIQADFSRQESLDRFCALMADLPQLDVLVNNAGINIIRPLDEVTQNEFDRVAAINYRAPYMLSQAAARVMRRQRSGQIINIGSIWSVITKKGRSPYAASKAGLAGISRALATELAEYNILVNCVSPGFVLTDLTQQSLSPAEMDALARQVPLGRMAEPKEIARWVAFLGSGRNTYMTGQNLVIDGGFTHV